MALIECSENPESQSDCAELLPRGYQLECLHKAREGNIIVCLETGCGKTLIAALLLSELSCLFPNSTPCIAVFLVPTVMLVHQQANVIKKVTDLKVGQYNGQDDNGGWDLEKWENDVYNLEVLVMTPQILLNVLRHALLKLEAIKVLVFDECHHCQKGHPYARIMEEFYFKAEICNRPKILGMTASPVIRKGKSEFQCTQDINSLERLLDAKIVTVENRNELEAIVPSPDIEIKEYDRVYSSLDKLQSLAEIIHKIKAKHSGQRWKAIDYKEQLGNHQRRNEVEGIEKICRDLEYCIYDLGLWFAIYAAKHVFSSDNNFVDDRVEGGHEATPAISKKLFLREIYENLDHATLPGGGVENLEVETLRPDVVSSKVISLVDVLLNFRFTQMKCIVFVERVVAAKVLAHFLCKVLKTVRCKHIVGKHSKLGSSNNNYISKILSDFRSGMVDLLVATNVAEEGLDIQDCCLVVQFDIPKTLRSFIQSRGRARVRSSHYVILKDKANISDEELLNTLIHSESFVKEKLLQGHERCVKPKEKKNGNVYEVESTGATVNTHSSVQLLHHYCSKLPSDQFYQPQPSFNYVKEQDGIKCSLMLPSNACIRRVEGQVCDSEVAAKKVACLKACRILHSKGFLTDYLLPQTSIMDGDADPSPFSRTAKATTEELQETVIPTVWLRQPTSSVSVMCLQAYKISFDAIPGDREYSSFGLLLQSPLPKEAANFCETFELRHGRAVICKLQPLNNVFLDHFQVAQAEQFQSALFSVLLDRTLEHAKTDELPVSEGSWYLLLPLKPNKKLNLSQDQEIDWDRITKLKPFGDSKHAVLMTENDCPKADGKALHFSNGAINIEDVPGLLVKTIHGKHLYCVIDMFTDLKSDSPFPNERYQTYEDYYKTMYGCELDRKGQHLLKARFLREAHNFLLARSRDKDHGSKDSAEKFTEADKSQVELPPEVCSIQYIGFYDDLVNAAVILPSLLHKLESILVATQFHKFLSSQFPEGSVVSVKKVHEALTTQKCLDSFSLERLELLGDSFLKYAISCHLFLVHEEADEGFLSVQRIQKICNSSLFTLGIKLGLAEYIRDSLFDPKLWVAPCHPGKALCDESKLRDLHGESSECKEGKVFVTCNKRHRWMQRKTVADAIEALIGAYLEDGGKSAALAFMKLIGLEVGTDTSQSVKIQSLSVNNLSLIKRIDIEALEKLLSYRFKHKGLLIEAFTHASFINHLGKCYQRLEFLGDSVLDFLITQHLYNEFKKSKPGELTDYRSTIVSNESFARIAIQYKLYEHLIENSVELIKCIKEFVFYIRTSSEQGPIGDWDGEKCPKVLGDIVESLSGAIYVDSGFDLNLVWKVFEPILQPLISRGNVRLHPVRELLEVCQKNRFTLEKSVFPLGGRQCQYKFEIHANDEVVNGIATAKDKKSAKRQAARDALAELKVLGYVHPCKSEALVSQRLPIVGTALKEEQSGKSRMSSTLQNLKPMHGSQRLPIMDTIFGEEQSDKSKISGTRQNVNPCMHADNSLYHLQDGRVEVDILDENLKPSIHTGNSIYHIQDDRAGINIRNERFEKIMGMNDVNEASFRGRTHWQERVVMSGVDYEAQNVISNNDNPGGSLQSQIDEIEDGQQGTLSNSPQGIPTIECSTPSRLVSNGSVWEHARQNNIEFCKPGAGLQQSNMAPGHSRTGPQLSERNEVPIRNEAKLHYENWPDLAADTACIIDMTKQEVYIINETKSHYVSWSGIAADTPCIVDTTVQGALKGVPRSALNETCARKRWKAPVFTCSREEGPPHNRSFTYSVILHLPPVGKIECCGDPRKTIGEAMDSAAGELLNWMASESLL